jgi:hypothetical protein
MNPDADDDTQGLNLAERIRRVANGRTTLDVAQFQFIGLKDIRERYGAGWPEKRDRVQTVARHFIAKRLDVRDVLIPGADGFLVVFGSATGVLADNAATRISRELNDFFIGSDADIRFEARRAEMSIDDLAQAFGDLLAESTEPPPPPQPLRVGHSLAQDLNQVRFYAHPVWDARREAITTYFLSPVDIRTGEHLDVAHVDHNDATRSHVDLDELQLKYSEEAIRRLFARGQRAFVGVSLHVSSLNSTASLTRLFSVMSRFDKTLNRYRVIRVAGVEPGFPRIYLEDITRTLKARIPNVAFGLNWQEPDIASMVRMQPASLGFTLAPQALSALGPRAEVFSRIHAAVGLAKAHDIPVFVEGDLTPDQVSRFAADGVQLLASPQLWPELPDLTGPQRWSASRLPHAAHRDSAA